MEAEQDSGREEAGPHTSGGRDGGSQGTAGAVGGRNSPLPLEVLSFDLV